MPRDAQRPNRVLAPRVLLAVGDRQAELTARLEDVGYSVTSVADGEALLRHVCDAAQHLSPNFDLIVCRSALAGCSGLEAVARLRAFDWSTPLVVVIASEEDHQHAVRLGAAEILREPFPAGDLVSIIESIVPAEPFNVPTLVLGRSADSTSFVHRTRRQAHHVSSSAAPRGAA